MANEGERDRDGAPRGSGREAERVESTYAGEAGACERSTPGREASRLVPDEEERRGHTMQGAPEVRGDAIAGPRDVDTGTGGGGERRNPPLDEHAGMGDGGISEPGGRSGGARGAGGRSDAGAGSPTGGMRSGPGEQKSTSRGDLDHPSE